VGGVSGRLLVVGAGGRPGLPFLRDAGLDGRVRAVMIGSWKMTGACVAAVCAAGLGAQAAAADPYLSVRTGREAIRMNERDAVDRVADYWSFRLLGCRRDARSMISCRVDRFFEDPQRGFSMFCQARTWVWLAGDGQFRFRTRNVRECLPS